jgi:hypothetical protein
MLGTASAADTAATPIYPSAPLQPSAASQATAPPTQGAVELVINGKSLGYFDLLSGPEVVSAVQSGAARPGQVLPRPAPRLTLEGPYTPATQYLVEWQRAVTAGRASPADMVLVSHVSGQIKPRSLFLRAAMPSSVEVRAPDATGARRLSVTFACESYSWGVP